MRAQSFPPGRPIYEAAAELMQRIKRDFAYDSKATEVTTPPAEAFAARRGVCQDFAHVMIAGAARPRPARALCQRLYPHHSAAGQGAPRRRRRFARLGRVGADRPSAGSASIRPTRSRRATITSSSRAGRDYADVPPVEGVILSSGGQKLDVEVDVIPVRA